MSTEFLWSGKPYLKKTIVKFLIVFIIVLILLSLTRWPPIILFWILFSIIVFPIYYYNKRAYTYYVTEKSVRIEKSWIFGRYIRELTFDQIRDVHVMQGILARAMNCGSIAFVTTTGLELGHIGVGVGKGVIIGGTRPRLIAWRGNRFWDIKEPQRAREILMNKIPEWREAAQQQRIATSVEKMAEKTQAASIASEIERLKKLLDEGVITREEFEKAKKKILE
ncbi:MAG: SHOCT domain-containing protein [Candidatus Bathyarchaeia archaeon]